MQTSELRHTLQKACKGLDVEASEVVAGVLAALERFSDKPLSDFLDQVRQLKPKRQRSTVATGEIRTDLIKPYVAELQKAFGDSRSTAEIMTRVRADKSVRKLEALAIAKALGVKPNSKTTKDQALSQAEGLSAQKERDRSVAERIRRGA